MPACNASRDPPSAGTSPNVSPAAIAIAAENASTRQSSVSRTAAMVSGTSVSRNRMTGMASARPATAPNPASIRLSTRNCVINRPRPAPSAARTRHFAASHDAARQQQIRQIDAGDQQHRRRRAQQHDQRRLRLPRQFLTQGRHDGRRAACRDARSRAGSSAAIDSVACCSVTPGLSRATQCTSCHAEPPQLLRGKRRRRPDVDVARRA